MNGATILLVEDDLDIRDSVQDVLEEEGYDVVPARNGRQALDFLKNADDAPCDLVVLDLMTPFVTGWQVLEEIRKDPRLAHLPVVVVTAMTSDRPTGASAVLNKPFAAEQLLQTIADCMEEGYATASP